MDERRPHLCYQTAPGLLLRRHGSPSKMQEIADKIEPGTVIEVRSRNPKAPYVVYNLKISTAPTAPPRSRRK